MQMESFAKGPCKALEIYTYYAFIIIQLLISMMPMKEYIHALLSDSWMEKVV